MLIEGAEGPGEIVMLDNCEEQMDVNIEPSNFEISSMLHYTETGELPSCNPLYTKNHNGGKVDGSETYRVIPRTNGGREEYIAER